MLEKIHALRGHTDHVWCVAWHPMHSLVASCSSDKSIRLWEVPNQSLLKDTSSETSVTTPGNVSTIPKAVFGDTVHMRTIRTISWSLDGKCLAAASFDATVSIWKFSQEENDWVCINIIEGHENEAKCVAWHRSSLYIATCSRDKTVWIHEATDSDDANDETAFSSDYFCAAILSGHTQDVKAVRWHPTLDILASASYDETIRIWGRVGDDWGHLQTLMGHTSTVWSISFNHLGTEFASCSDDKTVKIWSYLPSKSLYDIEEPEITAASLKKALQISGSVPPYVTGVFRRALVQHMQQQAASSAGREAKEKKFSLEEWKCQYTLDGYHNRSIYYLDWHPCKDLIATACGDNGLRIFKREVTREGGFIWKLATHLPNAHASDINCVAWKPAPEADGSHLLATAGDDDLVHIWRYHEPVDFD